jgi:hypothetical protein
MSKDSKEFITGIRSACTFLHSAIDSQFLAENKCSMRSIQIYQEFDYKGSRIWFRTGYSYGNLTLRDPHRNEVFPFDWKAESEFIKVVLADEQLSVNLQPRVVYFFADIHGQKQEWVLNLAENILLGTEPCLQKIEQPNSK